MLSNNKPVRIVFTLAILLNLFIAPWWLTFGWCLVGCLLFPAYFEAAACILLLDSVFFPGGIPVLSALIVVAMALTTVAFYSSNYHVDFS